MTLSDLISPELLQEMMAAAPPPISALDARGHRLKPFFEVLDKTLEESQTVPFDPLTSGAIVRWVLMAIDVAIEFRFAQGESK